MRLRLQNVLCHKDGPPTLLNLERPCSPLPLRLIARLKSCVQPTVWRTRTVSWPEIRYSFQWPQLSLSPLSFLPMLIRVERTERRIWPRSDVTTHPSTSPARLQSRLSQRPIRSRVPPWSRISHTTFWKSALMAYRDTVSMHVQTCLPSRAGWGTWNRRRFRPACIGFD